MTIPDRPNLLSAYLNLNGHRPSGNGHENGVRVDDATNYIITPRHFESDFDVIVPLLTPEMILGSGNHTTVVNPGVAFYILTVPRKSADQIVKELKDGVKIASPVEQELKIDISPDMVGSIRSRIEAITFNIRQRVPNQSARPTIVRTIQLVFDPILQFMAKSEYDKSIRGRGRNWIEHLCASAVIERALIASELWRGDAKQEFPRRLYDVIDLWNEANPSNNPLELLQALLYFPRFLPDPEVIQYNNDTISRLRDKREQAIQRVLRIVLIDEERKIIKEMIRESIKGEPDYVAIQPRLAISRLNDE